MHSLYADKETRDRLAEKSYIVYNSFNRWKKVAENKVMNLKEIEDYLDTIIKQAETAAKEDVDETGNI